MVLKDEIIAIEDQAARIRPDTPMTHFVSSIRRSWLGRDASSSAFNARLRASAAKLMESGESLDPTRVLARGSGFKKG
jgi:hypothetical protein